MNAISMYPKRNGAGRHPVKQHRILESLRGEILSGRLEPGDRLPTRIELEEQFGCSSVTIQRAVNQLLDDGFVIAKGRLGTFVTEQPPNLSEFALVVPYQRDSRSWCALCDLFLDQAPQISDCRAFNLQVFSELSIKSGNPAGERLAESVGAKRLAGMLVLGWDADISSHEIFNDEAIPVVSLDCRQPVHGVGHLCLSPRSFIDEAMKAVAEAGHKRPAVLVPTGFTLSPEEVVELAAAHGLDCQPFAIQAQDVHAADWCGPQVHLLLEQPKGRRPDAFIVVDDRLVQPVRAALDERELRLGEDLLLVARLDYPNQLPDTPGTLFIGYDTWEIAEVAVDTLRRMKDGEIYRQPIDIPAHRWKAESPAFLRD